MTLKKTMAREYIHDRSKELIQDLWIQSDTYVRDFDMAESMNHIVWIAGKNGEFRDVVVRHIREAEEFICLSTFLFGDEEIERALLDASERGVRVYMLCPSEKIDEGYEDEGDIDERIEEHKEFLDRVGGKILIRSSEHLHSKFILIDPKTPEKRIGFLSTANFNRALFDNPEIMLRLEDDEIDSLFMQFIHGFWEQAQSEHKKTGVGKGSFAAVSKPPSDLDTDMSLCHLPVTVKSTRSDYENLSLRETVMDFISASEGPLTVSTFGIDVDHDVMNALIKKAKTTDITILVPLRPAKSDAYASLTRAGIRVLGIDRLHGKTIIGERGGKRYGLVMTANLQAKGLDTGYETGIVLTGDRLDKVMQVVENWKQSARWIYKDEIEIGRTSERVLVRREITTQRGKTEKYVEEEILDQKDEELPEVRQVSLEIEPEPQRKTPSMLSKMVRYHWKVVRPELPSDAQELEEEVDKPLRLFKKGKQIYIAVSEEEAIPKAVQLKQSKYKKARIVIG